jgi:hypothetical protein
MKLDIEVAAVGECEVTECAYNTDSTCHARAITVGAGLHPSCDTFITRADHVQDVSHAAGVGACKVSTCQHNHDLECQAESIHVSHHGGHADCTTFSPTLAAP